MADLSALPMINIAAILLATQCMQDNNCSPCKRWQQIAAFELFNAVLLERGQTGQFKHFRAFLSLVDMIETQAHCPFSATVSEEPLLSLVTCLPPVHRCIFCLKFLPDPVMCGGKVTYIDTNKKEYPAMLFKTRCSRCEETYTASYHYSSPLYRAKKKGKIGWVAANRAKKQVCRRAYYTARDLKRSGDFKRRIFEPTARQGKGKGEHFVFNINFLIEWDVMTERQSAGALGFVDCMKMMNHYTVSENLSRFA